MSDNRSVDVLLRDGSAECYRWVLEAGTENTPLPVVLIAAIHETISATTERVLTKLDQLKLPNSPPVLHELWKEVIEHRRSNKTAYDQFKQLYLLLCNRVLRPLIATQQDVFQSQRALYHLTCQPQPLRTLMQMYCAVPHAEDPDWLMEQMINACPIAKRAMEKAKEPNASQEISAAIRDFIADERHAKAPNWERCPSLEVLWLRVLKRHEVDAPVPDEPNRYKEPLTLYDAEMGLLAAFVIGPLLEHMERIDARFEQSTFLQIAERVDQIFAIPYLRSLPAPSHRLDVAEPNPTEAVEGDRPPAAGPPLQPRGTGRTPDSATPVVILGEPGDEPIVNGNRKPKLTNAQYDVVKALLAAGKDGLSKDSLARKSGHGDAHRVLKRLAESDSDWAMVIQMAGKTGGRYRIRQNLPTSPDISRKAPTKRNKG